MLSIDERHKVRLWGLYELPAPELLGRFDVSALYQVGSVDARPYVVNPGCRTPQGGASVAYF